MNKIIVANMKMNLNYEEINKYLKKLKNMKLDNVIFCPTSIYIPYFIKENLNTGIQNISSYYSGNYTGEVSAMQAASLNVKYAIIGHSEVRNNLLETNDTINKKIRCCLENKIIPILCIGENIEEYKKGNIKNIIAKQLKDSFNLLNNMGKVIIAYEPSWAIDSNKIPKIEEIEEVVLFIKRFIEQNFKIDDIIVLYGGGVNENNARIINSLKCLDGLLIGKSSADINHLLSIIEVALN